MTVTSGDIVEAYEKLGSTADEIAATLANKGIRGARADHTRCPLAKYLHDQGILAVVGSTGTLTNYMKVGEAWEALTRVPNPSAIQEFMTQFDRGDLPELDESLQEIISDVYVRTDS